MHISNYLLLILYLHGIGCALLKKTNSKENTYQSIVSMDKPPKLKIAEKFRKRGREMSLQRAKNSPQYFFEQLIRTPMNSKNDMTLDELTVMYMMRMVIASEIIMFLHSKITNADSAFFGIGAGIISAIFRIFQVAIGGGVDFKFNDTWSVLIKLLLCLDLLFAEILASFMIPYANHEYALIFLCVFTSHLIVALPFAALDSRISAKPGM